MHQNNHRWSFITKEQRRYGHNQERARVQRCCGERAAEISARTHLGFHGRTGHLAYEKLLGAAVRHPSTPIQEGVIAVGGHRPWHL